VYLLVFHEYINEMRGSREAKSPAKYLVRQRCAEEFNSGVKELTVAFCKFVCTLPLSTSGERLLSYTCVKW
jgi:hypothetical protein